MLYRRKDIKGTLKSKRGVRFQNIENDLVQTVVLSIPKVERDFKRDIGFYIGPQGTQHAISNRYEEFEEFLTQNEPIEPPTLGWQSHRNGASFTDGRHRFAVLRDRGLKTMPFVVYKEEAELMRKRYS